MKILGLFLTLILSALILGCAATHPTASRGGYPFIYKNEQYRIESVTPKTEVGYNVLVLGDGEDIIIKAVDNDQDGFLDEVVEGNVALDKLQTIYAQGIIFGKMNGTVKNRIHSREYRTSDVINHYVLHTYKLTTGDVYNKLSIVSRRLFRDTTIILDLRADGSLNEVKDSEENPVKYQSMYDLVLKRGLKEGLVVKTDGMFEVIAKAM